MKLIDGWHKTLRRAWSVRLTAIAAAVSSLQLAVVVVGVSWIPLPQWVLFLLVIAINVATVVARIVDQKDTD